MSNNPELPSIIVGSSWLLEVLILVFLWSRRRVKGRFVVDDTLRRVAVAQKPIFVFATLWYLQFSASTHVAAMVYSDADYVSSQTLLVNDLRYVRESLVQVQEVQAAMLQYVLIQAAMCFVLFGSRTKVAASSTGGTVERAVPSQPAA